MAKQAISHDELVRVAKELFALLPQRITAVSFSIRLRCVIGEGHGGTDLYVVREHGQFQHILYERDLLRTIFEKLYALPPRVQAADQEWNEAVLRWERDGVAALSLGTEVQTDAPLTLERRDAWETREFVGSQIDHIEVASETHAG